MHVGWKKTETQTFPSRDRDEQAASRLKRHVRLYEVYSFGFRVLITFIAKNTTEQCAGTKTVNIASHVDTDQEASTTRH